MGSMLVGAFYLNSEPGSSTKDRNYYFDANGKMQDWSYPLDSSKANNRYVNRNIRKDGHNGIDISSYLEEPIYNVTGGTVLFSGWNQSVPTDSKSGTGNTVIIKTDTNPVLYVRYFHMHKKPAPITNTHISAGGDIGLVGNTGFSTGKHLHLDISELKTISANGNPSTLNPEDAKNPAAFFPYINFTGDRAFGADLN